MALVIFVIVIKIRDNKPVAKTFVKGRLTVPRNGTTTNPGLGEQKKLYASEKRTMPGWGLPRSNV